MEKINADAVDWMEYDHDGHAFRRKQLSNAVAAEQLGCSLYELPPGKRSWPYHYHTANEEAVFVLSGTGTLRAADGEIPLESGDFVAFPADEDGAHQLVNDGDEPLRCLMLSTMNEPDVTVYPEMGKFGIYVGAAPGSREERALEGYYRLEDETDYWEE